MRWVGAVAIVTLLVVGCGSAQPVKTVTVAAKPLPKPPTTETKPTTGTTTTPKPKANHKAKPGHEAKSVIPPGAAELTLEAIAGDEVLALSDGSVWSLDSGQSWSEGDTIEVGENEGSLYDATAEESEEASKIGDAGGTGGYAGEGEEHSIEAVSSDGSLLELEDNSVWSIVPAGQATSSTWSDGDSVSVHGGGPQYTLSDNGETVEAFYVGDKS